MFKAYSTGPVENAGSNAATSAIVKVLNNGAQEAQVDCKLFALNGEKDEVHSIVFNVEGFSSEFEIFDVQDILQYEIQVRIENAQYVLMSIWCKEADGNILAAQRFLENELNLIEENNVSEKVTLNKKLRSNNSIKKKLRR